jgi:hypothetical protein
VKKAAQSPRRRQTIILSQQLYLNFLFHRGAHPTLDAVGRTKGKIAGAEAAARKKKEH